MAEYELLVNHDKCTGCRICETACSIRHGCGANPEKSMIRIVALHSATATVFVPVKCLQCEKPPCEVICPTGAILSSTMTGARIIDKEKCIGCNACVYICPFGAATLDRLAKTASICDLCEGDPLCVRLCPFGALQYIRSDEVSITLKRARTDRMLDFLKFSTPPST